MRTYKTILTVLQGLLLLTCITNAAEKAEVSSPRHGVFASDKGQVVKYDAAGNVLLKFRTGSVHRIQQLQNGNVLCQSGWKKLIEVNPEGKTVWSYDAQNRNGNEGKRLEVHAFQRLENGNTMVVENGIGRIIEINKAGEIQHELKYQGQTTQRASRRSAGAQAKERKLPSLP